MNIIKAFEAAFYRAKENNWDYIYNYLSQLQ